MLFIFNIWQTKVIQRPSLLIVIALLLARTSAHALTLDEAIFAAQNYAPEIAASQASEDSANASRIAAGRLPDPQLTISLDSIPLEGSDRYRLNRTSRTISVMQDIPNSAKREAERQLADAMIQSSISQSQFARLNARREATLAWIELYYFDQKISVLAKQEEENQLRQSSTRASLAGNGSAEDALMAQIEQKELADARDELNRQIRSAQARLARWIGPELASQKLNGDLPEWLGKEHGFNDIANQPELRAAQAQVGVAQAELAQAIAQNKSDWSIEVGIGQDSMGETMGMVQLKFSLPIFESTRQAPRATAALAAVNRADAEREVRMADYQLEVNELLIQRETLNSQAKRLADETLPLLNQQINVGLARVRSDRGTLNTLLAARSARLNSILRQVDIQSQLALINAKLYFLTEGHTYE